MVLCHCAVPTFFLISGWLFFQKLQVWNWAVWKTKMNKRLHTLVIPYFLWISIYILWILSLKVGGVIFHGKPLTGIVEWITDNGGLRMYWDSHDIGTGYTPVLVPFWFIRDLMISVILSPVICFIIKKTKGWIILIITIAYVLGMPMGWHGFSVCYWFWIGSWLAIYNLDLVSTFRKLSKYGYLTFIILLVPTILYQGLETTIGRKIYPLYIMSAVITVVSIASFMIDKKMSKCIMSLSSTTFLIFAFHFFIVGKVGNVMSVVFSPLGVLGSISAYVITPIVTIIFCILLCRVMQKYLPKTAMFIGCR